VIPAARARFNDCFSQQPARQPTDPRSKYDIVDVLLSLSNEIDTEDVTPHPIEDTR